MKLEDYFKLSVELLPYNLWKFSFEKHFHFLNNQRVRKQLGIQIIRTGENRIIEKKKKKIFLKELCVDPPGQANPRGRCIGLALLP